MICVLKGELVLPTAPVAGELHLGLHLMSFTPWKCLFKAVLSAHGEFKQESSSFSSNFWKQTCFTQEGIPGKCFCNINRPKKEPVSKLPLPASPGGCFQRRMQVDAPQGPRGPGEAGAPARPPPHILQSSPPPRTALSRGEHP